MATIIKQVASNKSNLLLKIIFVEQTNITTKFKWKLITKVIKMPNEEAWV
jgi:hypothetical protein